MAKKKKEPEKPKNWFQKISAKWKIFWAVVIGISTLFGAYNTWLSIKEKKQTPTEKKKNAEHQEGDLKPKKIFHYYEPESNTSISTKPPIDKQPVIKGILLRKPSNFIHIQIGANIYLNDLFKFYDGVDIFKSPMHPQCDTLVQLIFGIHEDRLYASVVFRDLEKEEEIGWMDFNHWNLYLPNLMTFYNDDSTLEVKDKHNRIVFSIKYLEEAGNSSPTILINGYFISPLSVRVERTARTVHSTSSNCFLKDDKDYRQKAELDILGIISVKPKNVPYKL